jgi:hypothetical protein
VAASPVSGGGSGVCPSGGCVLPTGPSNDGVRPGTAPWLGGFLVAATLMRRDYEAVPFSTLTAFDWSGHWG